MDSQSVNIVDDYLCVVFHLVISPLLKPFSSSMEYDHPFENSKCSRIKSFEFLWGLRNFILFNWMADNIWIKFWKHNRGRLWWGILRVLSSCSKRSFRNRLVFRLLIRWSLGFDQFLRTFIRCLLYCIAIMRIWNHWICWRLLRGLKCNGDVLVC